MDGAIQAVAAQLDESITQINDRALRTRLDVLPLTSVRREDLEAAELVEEDLFRLVSMAYFTSVSTSGK